MTTEAARLTAKHAARCALGSALVLSLVACGDSNDDGASTPSTDATVAPTASAAPDATDAAVLGTHPYASVSDDWLVWSTDECGWIPATDHPDTYQAVLRTSPTDATIGYTPYTLNDALISAQADDVAASAAEAGLEITTISNEYPSSDVPMQALDQLLLVEPDVVISNNIQPALQGPIFQKLMNACIPFINYYATPAPQPAPAIGVNYAALGRAAAEPTIAAIEREGWTPEDIWLVMCGEAAVSQDVSGDFGELIAWRDAIVEAIPGIPEAQQEEILECPTANGSEGGRIAMTDWLTAHPDAKFVAGNSWYDPRSIGMAQALEEAGFTPETAIVSSGIASPDGIEFINTGSVFQITVDLNSANWGRWTIPVAQDALEGKPVPALVSPGVEVIDASQD